MSLVELFLVGAVAGSLAGFLAGYLGVGGGLVLVPALSWLFAADPQLAPWATHLAVASSLATMLVTSLSSILAHQRRAAIDWPVWRRHAPGLLAGALLGAWLASRLDTRQLALVFGAFAVLAGLQLLLGQVRERAIALPGHLGSNLAGFGIGSISSMVGIGGGSLTAPWFMWHGVRAQRAVATAAACGYPIALAGTLAFMSLGEQADVSGATLGFVHLPACAAIIPFSVLAAPLGATVVHRSDPALVRRLFGVLLLVVALKMLLRG